MNFNGYPAGLITSNGTASLSLLALADGKQSAPSLTFINDTKTGLYRETTPDSGVTLTQGASKKMKVSGDRVTFFVPPQTERILSQSNDDITLWFDPANTKASLQVSTSSHVQLQSSSFTSTVPILGEKFRSVGDFKMRFEFDEPTTTTIMGATTTSTFSISPSSSTLTVPLKVDTVQSVSNSNLQLHFDSKNGKSTLQGNSIHKIDTTFVDVELISGTNSLVIGDTSSSFSSQVSAPRIDCPEIHTSQLIAMGDTIETDQKFTIDKSLRCLQQPCMERMNDDVPSIVNDGESLLYWPTQTQDTSSGTFNYDPDGGFIKLDIPGWYQVCFDAQWDYTPAGSRDIHIILNGVPTGRIAYSANPTHDTYMSTSTTQWLDSGSTVHTHVYQDSGADLKIRHARLYVLRLF